MKIAKTTLKNLSIIKWNEEELASLLEAEHDEREDVDQRLPAAGIGDTNQVPAREHSRDTLHTKQSKVITRIGDTNQVPAREHGRDTLHTKE